MPGLGADASQNHFSRSRKIELSYSLVQAGRATTPPLGDFTDLLRLFPTTFDVSVTPPYLVIRVRQLPPRPWPLTVAGLPVDFRIDELEESFQRGRLGRGPRALGQLDLHTKLDYSPDMLHRAVLVFRDLEVEIRDIFWFGGFWQISVPDESDIKQLPMSIANSPVFYQKLSEVPDPDPPALHIEPPQGIEYDNKVYTESTNAPLRPGIMLTSSDSQRTFKTTTSGILVANNAGEHFITVSTHGFNKDGLVYHPNPKGTLIGKVVLSLPDTDISIVKLNAGLRYVNETFRTAAAQPQGIRNNGISPDYAPRLRTFDPLIMDKPFTGRSEGIVMGVGARITDLKAAKYVLHQWSILENRDLSVGSSCGSPILNAADQVVGLFRFKKTKSDLCLAVSAIELRNFGYEICNDEQAFI
ncbi:MAG: hypothetical protein M1812_005184 [Candelaria pacifica]|nr:MAG: hypothetical protein M1812_005184 [Candelaria pacifica]